MEMENIREILRLHHEKTLSIRQIARAIGISKSSVSDYINKAISAGISWPIPEEYDNAELEKLFFTMGTNLRQSKHLPDFSIIHEELKKKGVTLNLLWTEYKEDNSDGYSQFCEHYQRWKQAHDISMRQNHKVGEKMFVDFAGKGISITDKETGNVWEAQIFVAVLGASSYYFAKAVRSQSLQDVISAHIDAFEFFGGVPEIIVPDNLKAAVTTASRYEPNINKTYFEMARHYGTVVIPTRPGKPKDKAKVETGVKIITMQITAALRNHIFFSIEDANAAIGIKLIELNSKKFQKLNTSRKELFEKLEKPALKPLPFVKYEYAEWQSKVTVRNDYHAEVRGHFYSVPHQLITKKVDIKITYKLVEIFYKGKRVSVHKKSFESGQKTTLKEHMPKSHQAYALWNRSTVVMRAKEIGPNVTAFCENILSNSPHEDLAIRRCTGILSLKKDFGTVRLEAATARAIKINSYSLSSVRSILEKGLDKVPLEDPLKDPEIRHENIRGSRYYG